MEANEKHYSKLYKGFNKQVERQNKKPEIKEVEIIPIITTYDFESGNYIPICRTFWNNKYNGMNLKNLRRDLDTYNKIGLLHSKFRINKEGKYILTLRGQQILNRKKKNK